MPVGSVVHSGSTGSPGAHSLARLTATRPFFTRAEALAEGHTDKSLRALVRGGLIRRVRHGTYVLNEDWARLDGDQRHVVTGRAALARLKGVVLSHVTAALTHGMDVWGIDLDLVHVTRTDGGAGRVEAGVQHHEGLVTDDDVVLVDDVPVVRPARAALETALMGGVEKGLVTVDSGLRLRLFTPDDLDRQARLMRHWPEALPLHLVRRLADPSSESVAESRCGHLFWRLGLPAPLTQYPVHDATGQLIGRVDFAWPEQRLIVEFDGAVKYDALLRPGETANQAVIREKRREDRLRAAGWTVIRLCWADLDHPARVEALLRPHFVRGGATG
jgi:hypothetical protein